MTLIKRNRIFAALTLVLLFSCLLALPVSALEADPEMPEEPVEPDEPYVDIAGFYISCNVNTGGKAACYSYVTTDHSDYTIYLSLGIQRYDYYSDGTGYWHTIKSWSTSGTYRASLDKAWYVVPNHYYRSTATATVYTSSGSFVELVTVHSPSSYY